MGKRQKERKARWEKENKDFTEYYLIVECNELDDQWECDANRKPVRIVTDISCFKRFGFEIYRIKKDGTLKLIQCYDDDKFCINEDE